MPEPMRLCAGSGIDALCALDADTMTQRCHSLEELGLPCAAIGGFCPDMSWCTYVDDTHTEATCVDAPTTSEPCVTLIRTSGEAQACRSGQTCTFDGEDDVTGTCVGSHVVDRPTAACTLEQTMPPLDVAPGGIDMP